MNTRSRSTCDKLLKWADDDIEEVYKEAGLETPTSQRRLVNEIIRQIIAKEVIHEKAIKLIYVAQAILSSRHTLFTEKELSLRFQDLLQILLDKNEEYVDSAALIAALFLRQMRQEIKSLSPNTKVILRKVLDRTGSPRTRNTIERMIAQLDAAQERNSAPGIRVSSALPDLDLVQASKNVREDIGGDWYRDPWGWPEIEWLGKSAQEDVYSRLKTDECGWTIPIDVAKGNGGIRPGLVINPLDRIAYQAIVDDIIPHAIGGLPAWVYGWRSPRTATDISRYEDNRTEWKDFSSRVSEGGKDYRFTAHIDIQSFFSTVDTSLLIGQLGRCYRNTAIIDRLEAYLSNWNGRPNGSGIPQRSWASSLLSHIVIRPVDHFLDRIAQGGAPRVIVSRWLDDIWLHSDDENALRSCVKEIEGILEVSGLSLNSEKSEIFEGKDDERIVNIEDLYGGDDKDTDDGSGLDKLLEETEGAPQFVIGYKIAQLSAKRRQYVFANITPTSFQSISHLGNRFATFFRETGNWKKFTNSYVKYAKEHVSDENLSVASWGEMFPSESSPDLCIVREYFSNLNFSDSQRLLTPLAAKRIVSWGGENAFRMKDLSAFESCLESGDVFRIRGVAFASIDAGGEKREICTSIKNATDDISAKFLELNH